MANLNINFCGIKSLNPFWLASASPTNTGDQIMRAFDVGWSGAVWKTLSLKPIINISSRLAATNYMGKKLAGLTNLELSTDRPLETNLKEIYEVKTHYPKHIVVASITGGAKKEWQEIIKRCIDAGVDCFELNFSCPHGMCERGMGATIGQNIKAVEIITSWAKEFSPLPIIVKLTPNISDITDPARTAVKGGADAISLINTIKSISNLDLNTFIANPRVDKKFASGGYSGPAVKPIALHMLTQLAKDPEIKVPICGIGGIANWKDAADFIALGATNIQVCTAVMHHGFGIVQGMIDGLNKFLDSKNMKSVEKLKDAALDNYSSWGDLNLNYKLIATIDKEKCIGCQKCYVACLDGGHQCIHNTKDTCQAYHGPNDHAMNPRPKSEKVQHPKDPNAKVHVPFINEEECVGCNLCSLVCPVEDCITIKNVSTLPEESWNEKISK